jgi:hypothetical protein
MRLFIATGVALVATCVLAFADDDLMASRYGNTVIAKSTSGPEVHLYYGADHTVTGKVIGMDVKINGTWAMDGNNVCVTYDPPLPTVKNPSCVPLVAHQVGDSWSYGGRTITLVAGIQ